MAMLSWQCMSACSGTLYWSMSREVSSLITLSERGASQKEKQDGSLDRLFLLSISVTSTKCGKSYLPFSHSLA